MFTALMATPSSGMPRQSCVCHGQYAGNSSWVWNDPTSSTPALQKAGTTTDRIAATWYGSTSFTVSLNLTDGRSHRVAFYFLDWDAAGRAETVEISDASSGAILNSQSVSGFGAASISCSISKET